MSPKNATEIGQRRAYTFRGVSYPSVTTILNLGIVQEWKEAWAAKATAQRAITQYGALGTLMAEAGPDAAERWLKMARYEKRDAGRERGSILHDAAEHETELALVPEKARPFYRHYLRWFDGFGVSPVHKEVQVWSDTFGYGGSFDLIALIYGEWVLVDFKTTEPKPGELAVNRLQHSMRLQLAAYRYADYMIDGDEMLGPLPRVDYAAIVQLHPDGFNFVAVDAGPEAFEDFLAVKRVHDFVRRTEKAPVGSIVLPQASEVSA